jgi:2-methylisocitrate lyase-like PEP mutase family enzyme
MHPRRFRHLLARPGILRSLGAHDVFTARLIEAGGLDMIFLGGFGASASLLGLPDVGLITLTEMADAVRRMVQRVEVPVVADGDTGHGDLHNVARTVREFEQAGAAGVLLEDQVSPKRCGHFEGKQVIPADEMVLKLRAALAARRNPDFAILARTDALALEGVEAAIERANYYGEAGADVCFIEAPRNRQELERLPRAVRYPLLANMLTGGVTPILSFEELEQLGYKIAVCPIETLLIAGAAIQRLVHTLKTKGRVDVPELDMMTFAQVKKVLGLDQVLGLRDRLQDGP